MANRFARKTGNFNATDVWSDTPTGTAGAEFIPGVGDVAMANSFTVTITADATCAEVRTDTTGGATTGGQFNLSNGVTLTADVYAGGNSGVYFAGTTPNQCYIVGNVTSVGTGNGAYNNGTGTMNITGNVTAGTSGAGAYQYNGSGTMNIVGNVYGSTANGQSGVNTRSTGTVNITGNVYGGSGGTLAYGVYVNTTGTVTVNGNVYPHATSGAPGLYLYAVGTVVVTGEVHANGYGHGSAGITLGRGINCRGKTYNYNVKVGKAVCGALGLDPIACAYRLASTTDGAMEVRNASYTAVSCRPKAQVVPTEADVLTGVSFGLGAYTGTFDPPAGGSRKTNMGSPF